MAARSAARLNCPFDVDRVPAIVDGPAYSVTNALPPASLAAWLTRPVGPK